MKRNARLSKTLKYLAEALVKHGWDPKRTSLGLDSIRRPAINIEQHVMLNVIKKTRDGTFFQPCLGVRFPPLSDLRSELWESNKAVDALDFFIVAWRLDEEKPYEPFDWFITNYESEAALLERCESMLADVLKIANRSNIFETLESIERFVSYVEQTVHRNSRASPSSYLLALLHLERFDEAAELANDEIRRLEPFARESKNIVDVQIIEFYQNIVDYQSKGSA